MTLAQYGVEIKPEHLSAQRYYYNDYPKHDTGPRASGRTTRLVTEIVQAVISEETDLNIWIVAINADSAKEILRRVNRVLDTLGVNVHSLYQRRGLKRTFAVRAAGAITGSELRGHSNIRTFVDHSVYDMNLSYAQWQTLSTFLQTAKIAK